MCSVLSSLVSPKMTIRTPTFQLWPIWRAPPPHSVTTEGFSFFFSPNWSVFLIQSPPPSMPSPLLVRLLGGQGTQAFLWFSPSLGVSCPLSLLKAQVGLPKIPLPPHTTTNTNTLSLFLQQALFQILQIQPRNSSLLHPMSRYLLVSLSCPPTSQTLPFVLLFLLLPFIYFSFFTLCVHPSMRAKLCRGCEVFSFFHFRRPSVGDRLVGLGFSCSWVIPLLLYAMGHEISFSFPVSLVWELLSSFLGFN